MSYALKCSRLFRFTRRHSIVVNLEEWEDPNDGRGFWKGKIIGLSSEQMNLMNQFYSAASRHRLILDDDRSREI